MLERSSSTIDRYQIRFWQRLLVWGLVLSLAWPLVGQEESNGRETGRPLEKWLDTLVLQHQEEGFFQYLAERLPLYLGDFDPESYDSFLVKTKTRLGESHPLIAHLLYRYGRQAYSDRDYLSAARYLQGALVIWEEIPAPSQRELAYAYYYLGRAHLREEVYPQAISAYKRMATISKAIEDDALLSSSYEYTGDVYYELAEQELVELHYDLAILYAEKARNDQDRLLARLYLYGGNILDRKPEIAIQRYRRALAIYEAGQHQARSNYTSTKMNLARKLIQQEQYEEALALLLPIEQQKLQKGEEDDLDIVYENLGAIYRRKADFARALDYFEQELTLRQRINKPHSYEMNYAYHNLAELYQEKGDYQRAAAYYQKALQAADTVFTSDDFWDNPRLESAVLKTSNADLIQDLDYKGQLFLEWYREGQNVEKLQIALAAFERATDFMYAKRGELFGQDSKLIWQEQVFPVVDHYLEALYTAKAQGAFPNLEEQIFQLMERSKALVLMESLVQQRQAISFPGKDSLEAVVRQKQALFAERQRDILEQGETEARRIALLESKIAWRAAQSVLKNHQPAGQIGDLDLLLLSRGELAASLDRMKQGVIHYFLGEDQVYALLLTQKRTYTYDFPLEDLPGQINDLRRLLNEPDGAWATFANRSHRLYHLLLAPLLSQVDHILEELIIIPDGVLSALPFEVLLTQKGLEIEGFSAAAEAYLFHQQAITYAFSASTWQQQARGKNRRGRLSFLGVAPDFSRTQGGGDTRTCEANTLSPLLENGSEVERIQKILGGRTVRGSEASKSYFLAKAKQARVLHLATHACVDDEEPARSRIFFSRDHLYVHELYDLPLAADMVVLSACETGVGNFRRGEGVMSLARGFAASGAPSLTLSYWSVSDQSTAEMMGYYYTYLAKGLSKHRALQAAKIDYLSNQEEVRQLHPYYWAAFVHFGDFSALDTHSTRLFFSWTYLLLIPVLLFLWLFYKKIKKG